MSVKDFSPKYNSTPLKQFELLIMMSIHPLFLSRVLYSRAMLFFAFQGLGRGCDEEPFSLLYNLDEFRWYERLAWKASICFAITFQMSII